MASLIKLHRLRRIRYGSRLGTRFHAFGCACCRINDLLLSLLREFVQVQLHLDFHLAKTIDFTGLLRSDDAFLFGFFVTGAIAVDTIYDAGAVLVTCG
ncbi:Uncharacterised protein [uncultured archaeon]|nr:Uncharacterised protein [uncultured archaeon]